MARFLKRLPLYIFIAINLLVVMAMIVCAYAPCLPPQRYPSWSYFGMLFPMPLALDVLFVFFWLTFKRRLVALPIAGMLLCAGAVRTFCPVNFHGDVPEGSIKVLSYNLYNFGKDRSEDWDNNACVQYVLDQDADIVCLQECLAPGMDEAFRRFAQRYPYMETFAGDNNNLCFLSKFPILSSTNIKYESSTNFSYAYELLVGNDTVVAINNHFESYHLADEDREQYKDLIKNPENEGAEAKYNTLVGKLIAANKLRGPQADSVAAYIERNAGRYIIACGDFNDASLSYTHHRLTRHLNDAFTRSGCGLGISYNRSGMYFRIDNILCSPNIKPCSAKVDDFITASDHYPIIAYLKLEER